MRHIPIRGAFSAASAFPPRSHAPAGCTIRTSFQRSRVPSRPCPEMTVYRCLANTRGIGTASHAGRVDPRRAKRVVAVDDRRTFCVELLLQNCHVSDTRPPRANFSRSSPRRTGVESGNSGRAFPRRRLRPSLIALGPATPGRELPTSATRLARAGRLSGLRASGLSFSEVLLVLIPRVL